MGVDYPFFKKIFVLFHWLLNVLLLQISKNFKTEHTEKAFTEEVGMKNILVNELGVEGDGKEEVQHSGQNGVGGDWG